jgi:HlyD family secretion protein
VADLHAGRVQEGLPVILPLGKERLRGRVVRVLPAIQGGQLQFEAELDEPDHQLLRASLRVDLRVVTAHRPSALTLPRGASLNGSGPQEVFVVDGEFARRRNVEIGLAGVDGWEVLEGLEEGERVIVSDVSTIRHLSEVRWRSKP